jgi:type II secretory pathway predicted ATPase ExeA/septal ring-binding cell division protein DamX
MYNDHFGLERAPFKITPDTRLFYPGGSRGEVLEALVYAVTSGEGIVKVVGEVGSGKTMLCRMLEERLPESVDIVYLVNPSLSPEDTLHAIALEMKLDVDAGANRLQVMHVLQQRLLDKHSEGRRVVVLVEEAQSMPIATLEEIRLLSNLETKHDKLLQIVLFGQPELDDNLEQPEIRQLKERITHSFFLQPFTSEQIRQYVNFRLRAVGYRGPDMFRSGAYRPIVQASAGLTRRINILADKALLAAFAEDTHDVARRHVKIAISDSQFLKRRRWGLPEVTFVSGLVLIGAAVAWALFQGDGRAFARLASFSTGAPGTMTPTTIDAATPVSGPLVTTAPAAEPGTDTAEQGSIVESQPQGQVAEVVPRDPVAPAAGEAGAPRSGVSANPQPPATPHESGRDPAQVASLVDGPVDPPANTRSPAATYGHEDGEARLVLSDSLSRLPGSETASNGTAVSAADTSSDTGTLPVAKAAPADGPSSIGATESARNLIAMASSAPAVGAVPADVGPLTGARLLATRDWLQRAEGGHFSIQLLLTDFTRRDNLEAFLRDRQLAGEIEHYYVYETRIRSRVWYGVLYRDYATFREARGALDTLPPELRLHQPFIRNVRDIAAMG